MDCSIHWMAQGESRLRSTHFDYMVLILEKCSLYVGEIMLREGEKYKLYASNEIMDCSIHWMAVERPRLLRTTHFNVREIRILYERNTVDKMRKIQIVCIN